MIGPIAVRRRPLPLGGLTAAWPAGLRPWAATLTIEPLVVLTLMAVGLLAHGLNMFNYPALTYKEDEGIYAAQAWAILREQRLTPYTYFYDHAPAGWILLAGWMWITGGLDRFGTAVESGRVLMLLLHLAMVPLLYRLARKLGCGVPAAGLAAALFSLSPLAIFYQRFLLLDTIMLFWAFLSLDLLLDGRGRLSRVVLSGACFGLAALSKENAAFLLPALLFIAVQQRWRHQGRFAVGGWLLPMAMVLSWYPLFALLKGELLPAGLSIGLGLVEVDTGAAHVSLIDALRWQLSRSGGGMFNGDNQFWQLVRADWLPRDPLLFVGGALATGLNLLRGVRDRCALAAGLLGALPLYFLGRGGVVLDYYILFAIPFLCLNLAVLVAPALARMPARAAGPLAALAAGGIVVGHWQAGSLEPLFEERRSDVGREAVAWIKRNVPADSTMILRDDFWTDLREPGRGGPAFPNAHSHWKVAQDPEVRGGVFRDDWRTVDYLVMWGRDFEADFVSANNTVALDALRNAHLVKRWWDDRGDHNLHPVQVIELWKVDKAGPTEAALLAGSAAYLADRFERDGAYAEPDGTVTSEAQAYAMLRAVWSDDRAGFDRAWAWTVAHLADADGLLAWLWRGGAVVDAHTAMDADTDAALALLLAGKRWDDPALVEAGTRMVRAIWRREVVTVDGVPYITAGDWAGAGPIVALNPSYFSPYAYRIFREVDPEHDWLGVVDSGYRVLFAASEAPLGAARSAGLPPDWVGLDRAGGQIVPLRRDQGDTTRYGYDAVRTYWRVALDRRWTGDGRAETYLNLAGFLQDEVKRKGVVSAVYEHDGEVVEYASNPVGNAGALAALLTLDPEGAHRLYAEHFVGGAARAAAGIRWGDPNSLYGQEWGWFATALYADALPDLWHAR